MFGLFKNLFSKADTTQLKQFIDRGAFLVDVRSPAEFAQGSVEGSTNIPLDQLRNQLAEFREKEQIIVFCQSGNRSSMAKTILQQNGITNVTNGGTWRQVNALLK